MCVENAKALAEGKNLCGLDKRMYRDQDKLISLWVQDVS